MSFWARTWFPPPGRDRLAGHGDYRATRARYFARPESNLGFLVHERYAWMRPWLAGRSRVVELGAGPGLSREVLGHPGLEVTDVLPNEWIDRQVDAMALPYEPASLDAVICSQMIHHVASPVLLLQSLAAVLKPGGVLLVNESTTSLCHRAVMWAMRHEGWSHDIDVYDAGACVKEGLDPLAGNNAVAHLLFGDTARFAATFPGLEVRHDEYTEMLVFLLSGGVGGEVFTIELPRWAQHAARGIDRALIGVAPRVFAFARRLVIVKNR